MILPTYLRDQNLYKAYLIHSNFDLSWNSVSFDGSLQSAPHFLYCRRSYGTLR